jgi:hypothetical protein
MPYNQSMTKTTTTDQLPECIAYDNPKRPRSTRATRIIASITVLGTAATIAGVVAFAPHSAPTALADTPVVQANGSWTSPLTRHPTAGQPGYADIADGDLAPATWNCLITMGYTQDAARPSVHVLGPVFAGDLEACAMAHPTNPDA